MADTLESLEIKIQHNASGADAEIDKLAAAVERLGKAVGDAPTSLKNLSTALKSLKDTFKGNNADKFKSIADSIADLAASAELLGEKSANIVILSTAMSALSNVKISSTSFTSVATGVEKIGTAVSKISSDTISNFERLANSLAKLQGVDLSGLGSAIGAVNKVKPQKEKSPLSASTQIFIATANEVDILRAKLAQLRQALLDAFDAGDLDKALSIRSQIIQTEKAIEKATGTVSKFSRVLSALKATGNAIGKVFGFITSAAKKVFGSIKKVASSVVKLATSGISKWFEKMRDNIKSVLNPLDKLFSSLTRIAFYRLIRSAIKAVTDALKEGSDNAYFFARNFGNATKYIADAMDSLKSAHFKMSNQLGAAWNTLLATITPM